MNIEDLDTDKYNQIILPGNYRDHRAETEKTPIVGKMDNILPETASRTNEYLKFTHVKLYTRISNISVQINEIKLLPDGWLELILADDKNRDDVHVIVRWYTPFTLYFQKG